MVNLDKYRDEIEVITNESESTLSRMDLVEHRKRLLKIFGDMFGVEWRDDGEKVERGEKSVDEEDEIIYQYESKIDEIGSQPAATLSVQELRRQRRRLIEIFKEIDEDQSYGREEIAEDDKPADDEETVV